MGRKSPGPDGPLQKFLQDSTEAATKRATEGQEIYSPIAAFLDKHRGMHRKRWPTLATNSLQWLQATSTPTFVESNRPRPTSPSPQQHQHSTITTYPFHWPLPWSGPTDLRECHPLQREDSYQKATAQNPQEGCRQAYRTSQTNISPGTWMLTPYTPACAPYSAPTAEPLRRFNPRRQVSPYAPRLTKLSQPSKPTKRPSRTSLRTAPSSVAPAGSRTAL